MAKFELPTDLKFNRDLIQDPGAYAKESGSSSWLYLIGEEFASMDGGMIHYTI